MIAEVGLAIGLVTALVGSTFERIRWDKERRSYIAAAIAASTSPSVAAHILQPRDKPKGPSVPRPVQLDL